MSLRAASCAVHNLCIQAPLTLRGICNGQRTRDRYCNLCHPHVMTIVNVFKENKRNFKTVKFTASAQVTTITCDCVCDLLPF